MWSYEMLKMLSIDSLCLRENQNPILFCQNSLWNSPKSSILYVGTKAHSELPWLFPECLFCTSGVCLTYFIPRSASPGMCWGICFWVPFPLAPGVRLGRSLVPAWTQELRRLHSRDITLACLAWIWLHLIWFVA